MQDRYATAESRPPVDAQQNWILEAGEEENGYTVLAFRRDWVTCDDQDRDIKVGRKKGYRVYTCRATRKIRISKMFKIIKLSLI